IGMLTFQSTSNSDVSGNVVWLKPHVPTAKFYPAGFNFATTAEGSRYHRPAMGSKGLNFTSGTVMLSGGHPAQPITDSINLGANNRVSSVNSNKLTLTFKSTTGSFTGKVLNPGTTQMLIYNGVILQGLDVGSGFFLGTSQSGQVLVQGSP